MIICNFWKLFMNGSHRKIVLGLRPFNLGMAFFCLLIISIFGQFPVQNEILFATFAAVFSANATSNEIFLGDFNARLSSGQEVGFPLKRLSGKSGNTFTRKKIWGMHEGDVKCDTKWFILRLDCNLLLTHVHNLTDSKLIRKF